VQPIHSQRHVLSTLITDAYPKVKSLSFFSVRIISTGGEYYAKRPFINLLSDG